MKRTNLVIIILLVFCGLFTIQSCKKDKAVAFTEHGSFTDPTILAPVNGGYITLTGGATTVDLKWESTNANGDPEKWDVYFGTGDDPALVLTGTSSHTYTATVVPGGRYNWRVTAVDANGMPTRSPIWSFQVVDPAAALKMKMTWTTDAEKVMGLTIAPDAAVDLRLLILKADKSTTAVPIINGTSFEEFNDFNTLADGTYYIATDISKAVSYNNGSLVPFDISIDLTFAQKGTKLDPPDGYGKVVSSSSVMNSQNVCALYKTVLAKVVKAGNTYTIDKSVSYITPPVLTWNGLDATYASQVTSTATCSQTTITGLDFGWMLDWWGEVITSGGTCTYTVSGSTITIPLQLYCKTTYNGAAQTPYYIQGTGTITTVGGFPVWTIHYDLKQGSTWVGADAFVHYGWTQNGFDAVLTTAPGSKGLNLINTATRPDRPVR